MRCIIFRPRGVPFRATENSPRVIERVLHRISPSVKLKTFSSTTHSKGATDGGLQPQQQTETLNTSEKMDNIEWLVGL